MRPIQVPTNATLVQNDNGEIDLLQLLGTLRRGKWHIMAYTFLAAAFGAYYAIWMATPVYTAVASVTLNQRSSEVVDLASPLSALDGTDFLVINTEVETMQSRDLAEKLVKDLNLVEDPVFNPALRPPEQAPSFSIRALINQGLQIILPRDTTEVKDPGPPTEADVLEGVVDMVMGTIAASNILDSYVFQLEVTTESPEASMRVANGLAKVYIEDQIAIKYEATEQATNWLTKRVSELEIELEVAENAVKSFNAETDLVGPETLEALNRQLKDRRDRVEAAKTQANQLEAQVTDLMVANQSGDRAEMSALTQDPALRQLLPRLNDAGAQKTFDQRFGQILDRAQVEAVRARSQIEALAASVTDLEMQVERQSIELLKLEQLEREAGASRQIYEYFLGRLKETAVQQGVHQADSRILSKAVLPRRPSAPRKANIVLLATLVGFTFGCMLVLIREMRQTGFRSAQELEQAAGITVFAQIPKAPYSRRKRILSYLATKSTSAMVEAVRNLRTSVLLSNIDTPPQIIMMTSSLPGEGKTTQSLALAQSFAGMEKKVLLIEGDIRRRTFQEYFDVRGKAGLAAAVSGAAPLEEILVHSDALGVDILIGERSTVNAADFFSSSRFRTFLSHLRSHYDVIIIDTPPVLVVPDARVIGPMVDAVIYAVHWNKTTRAQLEEGVHSLQSVDIKISGLSLNQIDMRKAQSYGGKYGELYGYNYGRKYYNS